MSNLVRTLPARTSPVVHRSDVQVTFYERRVKRLLDVALVLLQLPIVLPLVALLALAIRIGVGPGVFYTQRRAGRGGRSFTIVKFRTMQHDRRTSAVDVDTDRRTAHKVDHDPRHTALGRAFRRFSLDELPQLWNVLKGDMSLVGPRPEMFGLAQERGLIGHVRHRVRPGMTGPYQVSDLRFNGDLRDGLELDEQYVERITLRGDLGYMLRTLMVFGPTAGGS